MSNCSQNRAGDHQTAHLAQLTSLSGSVKKQEPSELGYARNHAAQHPQQHQHQHQQLLPQQQLKSSPAQISSINQQANTQASARSFLAELGAPAADHQLNQTSSQLEDTIGPLTRLQPVGHTLLHQRECPVNQTALFNSSLSEVQYMNNLSETTSCSNSLASRTNHPSKHIQQRAIKRPNEMQTECSPAGQSKLDSHVTQSNVHFSNQSMTSSQAQPIVEPSIRDHSSVGDHNQELDDEDDDEDDSGFDHETILSKILNEKKLALSYSPEVVRFFRNLQ